MSADGGQACAQRTRVGPRSEVGRYRLLVRKSEDAVRIYTRRGADWTKRFPRIVTAVHKLKAKSVLLDGKGTHFNGQSTVRLDSDHAAGEGYRIAHHLTADRLRRQLAGNACSNRHARLHAVRRIPFEDDRWWFDSSLRQKMRGYVCGYATFSRERKAI